MPELATDAEIVSIPKVELHIHLNGSITFGKAIGIGLLIALIASIGYSISWEFYFNLLEPDFMDKYAAHMIEQAKSSGVSAAELDKKVTEMAGFKEMYKNPLFVILITYMEILPIGILITLISAFILKRK